MSTDVALRIYDKALSVPTFWIEDVFITGRLLLLFMYQEFSNVEKLYLIN